MSTQIETAIAGDIREYTDHDMEMISKRILSHREILAQVLRSCTMEFRDIPLSDTIKGIVGDPEVSRVVGDNTEDMTQSGGLVRYDIRFRAITPTNEETELIVNIESQKNHYPGYSLVKRGTFYGSTLLSGQKDTVFKNSEYDDIRKVYSIWICTQPPKSKANTIKRYRTIEEDVVGRGIKEPQENYDLITIVMVYVGSDNHDGILGLLETLLISEKSVEHRLDIMEREYGIEVSTQLRKEMSDMCSISQVIEDRGVQKGEQKGKLELIINLLTNTSYSIEEAMNVLGIPKEEQPMYREKIGQ